MKFVCLGYMDERMWDAMSQSEQDAMMEDCFAYDDGLEKNGHWVGRGEALQGTGTARTLRRKEGTLLVTDGPYAETREQLGGFGMLEARDIDHAVELMSNHPAVRRGGSFEIRPLDEEVTERSQVAPTPVIKAHGMKFICLAYGEENNWTAMSERERETMIAECISYGDLLRKEGGWVGGAALQAAGAAKTLRSRGGKLLVTDGPYAETKEQLGGVATFRFRDMDHAVEAWSQHPCLRAGDALELRPADEKIDAVMAARQMRTETGRRDFVAAT